MDTTRRPLEATIGRLLTLGTYLAVALVAIGVVLMAIAGVSPLHAAPALSLRSIGDDIAALRPAGFLWLGLIVVLATPSARVLASLIGYARSGERGMAAISALILLVVALGVLAGTAEG
jgi:uncharacterized membrane protein